jgi:hypothetical protein
MMTATSIRRRSEDGIRKLIGQRIRFRRRGDVLGVVGKKPIHLMEADGSRSGFEDDRSPGGHRRPIAPRLKDA